MSEDLNARLAGIIPEIGIAILAGGLSWVATPPGGLVMHWGEAGEPGWKMAASGYAIAAAIITFVLGHIVSTSVAHKTGLNHLLPGPAAAAVLCVAFPGLQRVGAGVAAVPAALLLAVVVYFLVLWVSVRRTAPPQDPPAVEV